MRVHVPLFVSLLFAAFFLLSGFAVAEAQEAVNGGLWSDPATWSDREVPGEGDAVIALRIHASILNATGELRLRRVLCRIVQCLSVAGLTGVVSDRLTDSTQGNARSLGEITRARILRNLVGSRRGLQIRIAIDAR